MDESATKLFLTDPRGWNQTVDVAIGCDVAAVSVSATPFAA